MNVLACGLLALLRKAGMASKLLERLRRTLFKDGELAADTEKSGDDFPESSELEDDTDCVSTRLRGTLCFEGDGAVDSEEEEDDSDSDFFGESYDDACSSTDTSPPGPSPQGVLTRQLQESWQRSRQRPVPQTLLFQVTDASVVHEGGAKYVLYTVHLVLSGSSDKSPALITRRYTDFSRLHSRLRSRHADEMDGVRFPRKKLRGNFAAETIGKRSRAFERYLTHLQSRPRLRATPTFLEFFYVGDLRAGQALMGAGRYPEARAALLNALRLQEKLGCPLLLHLNPLQKLHWLFTLSALVVCCQELEELDDAQGHCERVLRDLDLHHHHHLPHQEPLLVPLLQCNVRLSWKISKDKRRWEAVLQELQEQGVDLASQPQLKERVMGESLRDSEGV